MIPQQDKSGAVELLVCTGLPTAIKGLSAAAKEKQYVEMNLEKRQGKRKKEISALWPSLALKQRLPNKSGILYFRALNAAPVCLTK